MNSEDRVARMERLIEISRSLNSTLNLRPLLHRIVETAQELTNTEACSILLLDSRSGELHFEAATNLPGVRSIVVPMEGSIAGDVIRQGKPVVISNAQQDSRIYREADEKTELETRSILAVPLIAREKVVGVLEAINKRGGADFSEEDLDLMTVLGDQAAVAVQNALLFQQTDLIAEFVHEMRTPLTSIASYADLMQQPALSPAQHHQFSEIIRQEAERLGEMAEEYLDLARLESGRASVAQDPVDMKTVIYMTVNVVKPQADDKRISISVDVPSDLPLVMGDAQRLHQVMINLLGNAVKYCQAGDRVTVTAESKKDCLSVSVADTGPGIPTEAQPHIFERFYRVPDVEGEASGAGLGLTISRRIVEAHDGEIHLTSEVGKGTTFTLALPLA